MKIGILSFAHLHAESYANALNVMPGVELMGIADDDAARGEQFRPRLRNSFLPILRRTAGRSA